MKKRIFWAVFAVVLAAMLLLLALEQYYVAVALVIGTLILLYRELWSLLTKRRMPPVDERVRSNSSRAIRNGFIYLAVATAFLMMPFGEVVHRDFDTTRVLGVLFMTGGAVYMFSYLYFDRVEPTITSRRLRLMKAFLLTIGISVGTFIVSVFLHNLIFALFEFEEAVFFVIAVIVSPLACAVGVVGSLVLFFMGLAGRPVREGDGAA